MKLMKHEHSKSGALTPVSKTWQPFWPLRRLREDIDRLFEEPFGLWPAPSHGLFGKWGPAVDVYEDKDNVFVEVEIPGMKKEEIEVFMSGEELNIAGERKEEAEYKGAEIYRSERYFGSFHRSIALPTAVDAKRIQAHYRDGVLTVTCPKTEEARRKEVEIKVE